MVKLIICTVLGNCTLIYCVKMHAKVHFLAVKGLFYCTKVLNYVHYTVKYTRITVSVCEATWLVCAKHGKNAIH